MVCYSLQDTFSQHPFKRNKKWNLQLELPIKQFYKILMDFKEF
jgi:hypothetical protein